jgi:hypothetical protein
MQLMTEIHIRPFTGDKIKNYLHSLAKLMTEVFKEYPYMREANLAQQTEYIKKAASTKESIAVLIFDNTTLVGASLGLPLSSESKEIQQPFAELGLSVSDVFFFSASQLLKPYRRRGIGHHFFDVRETHVQHHKKFSHISFCVPEMVENDPLRPDDYLPLENFWRKRGYVHHPEMQCNLLWTPIQADGPHEKRMTFWLKKVI